MTEPTVQAALNIPETRYYLATLQDRLAMFVIYDSPSDWPPGMFVARLWLTFPEPTAMPLTFGDRSLERLQTTMEALGLTKLARSDGDDPVILETWL